MHELHDHLSQTLSDRISRRQVVTWYDPRREFTAFVAELAGGSVPDECRIDSVVIGNVNTKLCVLQDSFFEVKFTVEPHVTGDLLVHAKYRLAENESPHDVSVRLNDVLLSALATQESPGYCKPVEAFKLLSRVNAR